MSRPTALNNIERVAYVVLFACIGVVLVFTLIHRFGAHTADARLWALVDSIDSVYDAQAAAKSVDLRRGAKDDSTGVKKGAQKGRGQKRSDHRSRQGEQDNDAQKPMASPFDYPVPKTP